MEHLWAPWRMEYILAGEDREAGCIFCRYPAEGRDHFRERGILCVTEHAFAILNKFPYSNGHLMIVPRRHVADPAALAATEHQALAELLRCATTAVRTALAADGLNVGMNLGRVAGAGIADHCHWHIVPRWTGDSNFMAVLGETRVIAEHLRSTYERLLPHFGTLGDGPS